MTVERPPAPADELRLGAPEWVLDLLLFTAMLCGVISLVFLPDSIDVGHPSRQGEVLLTVSSAVLGIMLLLGVRAVLRPGPGSCAAARLTAVLLCLTVVLLPVGLAVLVGLRRARAGVWRYGPASRGVALLLLVPLTGWTGLGVAAAADPGVRDALPPSPSWRRPRWPR